MSDSDRRSHRVTDFLFPLFGDTQAGDDDVEPLCVEGWNQRVESLDDEFAGDVELCTNCPRDIRVKARYIAAGVSHAIGRGVPLGSDGQEPLRSYTGGGNGSEQQAKQTT